MRSGNVQAIGTHDQRHYGTVTVVLVATNVYVALKSRTQYVPVAGSVNATVALGVPAAGRVCDPFRYCHCRTLPSASYNPTQSPGSPGPLAIVAVTVPPALPVVALRVTVGSVVVIDPLVATNV